MKSVVLIDTNVVIDLLAKREPFWQSAAQLFMLAEQNQIEAYVSSLTLATVYYILRTHHKIPHRQIIDAFGLLTSYIGIADVTIITRNTADFSSVTTPVFTPDAWLAKHYIQ